MHRNSLATVSITVSTNVSNLRESTFDILKAKEQGYIELVDPDDEEDTVKDIITTWPARDAREPISFGRWWQTYAMPLLNAKGKLGVSITGEAARAGFFQSYFGAEPHATVGVDEERVAGEAGRKLAKIAAVLAEKG